MAKRVPVKAVRRRLRPLIAELKKEGRKNFATVRIGRIAEIAAELQRWLDGFKR